MPGRQHDQPGKYICGYGSVKALLNIRADLRPSVLRQGRFRLVLQHNYRE